MLYFIYQNYDYEEDTQLTRCSGIGDSTSGTALFVRR